MKAVAGHSSRTAGQAAGMVVLDSLRRSYGRCSLAAAPKSVAAATTAGTTTTTTATTIPSGGGRRVLSSKSGAPPPPPASSSPSSLLPRVVTDIDANGVARVHLNRPSKLNAVDLPMFESIRDSIQHLRSKSHNLRAVLLHGGTESRAFCSGLDVKSIFATGGGNPLATARTLLERPNNGTTDLTMGPRDKDKTDSVESTTALGTAVLPNLAQEVAIGWRTLPVPVVCVVHGACFGAGLQIALGADIRVATHDSQWSIMEGKWGLIPDMSASVLLRELVRIDVAKDLTFTGRIVSGTEAHRLGLVTHVFDTREEALEFAEEWAAQLITKSPDALKLAKQLFHETWHEPNPNKCLQLESTFQRRLLATWNQLAASGRSALGWNIPYW